MKKKKKMKKKDFLLIGFLFLALITTMVVGIYRDKKIVIQNKELAETLKLEEIEKIKENTQYYLNETLKKLDNEEDTMFMFIGDSVTAGFNSSDKINKGYVGLFSEWIAEKYPNSTVKLIYGENMPTFKPLFTNLKEKIVQSGTKNTITVVNTAIQGDGMYQLFNRANEFISYNSEIPDCIFIMGAINDADTNNTKQYSPVDKFKELQESFVDYLQDETGAEIAIMTSHWAGEKIDSNISSYVNVQRKIAKDKNLLLIDNKEIWDKHYNVEAENHGQGDWMLSDDPVHPTDEGHKAIFQNIIDNLYKTTLKEDKIINMIKMNDSEINYEGNFEDITITDDNGDASYNYKRITGDNSKVNVKLKGDEVYVIVRDGRDSVKFDNSSEEYTGGEIKIGGSEYPEELVTVNNEDMYSAHHKRILLYDGKNQECNITLKNIEGNLDIYGFETVTYNK